LEKNITKNNRTFIPLAQVSSLMHEKSAVYFAPRYANAELERAENFHGLKI